MCILLIFFQIKLSYLLHSTTIYPFYNPAKSALLQKTKKRSPASLTRDRKASAVPPQLALCPNACTLLALLPITQEKTPYFNCTGLRGRFHNLRTKSFHHMDSSLGLLLMYYSLHRRKYFAFSFILCEMTERVKSQITLLFTPFSIT